MALQKTLVLANGLTATDAYHKITSLTVQALGSDCRAGITVVSYANATLANADGAPVHRATYELSPFDKNADDNAHAQAYAYLKTLDAFSGASDV